MYVNVGKCCQSRLASRPPIERLWNNLQRRKCVDLDGRKYISVYDERRATPVKSQRFLKKMSWTFRNFHTAAFVHCKLPISSLRTPSSSDKELRGAPRSTISHCARFNLHRLRARAPTQSAPETSDSIQFTGNIENNCVLPQKKKWVQTFSKITRSSRKLHKMSRRPKRTRPSNTFFNQTFSPRRLFLQQKMPRMNEANLKIRNNSWITILWMLVNVCQG